MGKNLAIIKILVFCFLFVGITSCAMLPERAGDTKPGANLVITPISAPPKSVITIRGSGFLPKEKVEIIMIVDGIPVELGEEPMIKEANEMGAFKVKSAIPLNAKPGMYTVKASGNKGTIAVAPLEVEEKKK